LFDSLLFEREDRSSPARPNLVRAWWPAAVWVGLISIESSDAFSSQSTGSLLYALLTRLFGEINLYDFLIFHFYLRKTGHVVGYGMLALLLLRGWRATLGTLGTGRLWLDRSVVLAWIGTVFVAAMDEWHQSFIPSRTGAVHDVVLDSIAGLAFLLVAYLWLRRFETAAEQAIE
jgi:VanZ like family